MRISLGLGKNSGNKNMTHPGIKERVWKKIDLWSKLSLRKLAEPEVYHVQR